MKLLLLLFLCVFPLAAVPVGEYLYANPEKLPAAEGSLTVQFSEPVRDGCILLAWGRKYRKNIRSKKETTEAQREIFKPRIARFSSNRKSATFPQMQPDFYDLLLIDPQENTLTEGLSLLPDADETENGQSLLESIRQHLLGLRDDGKINAWEGFFDDKEIARVETDPEEHGTAILLQQQRTRTAFEESGEKVKGYIRSIDVVWLVPALKGDGWQVIQRQQLYRKEHPNTEFFHHRHDPRLSSIRVGTKPKSFSFPE